MREEINYKRVKWVIFLGIIGNLFLFIIFCILSPRIFAPFFLFYQILLFLIAFFTEGVIIRLFLGENKPDETYTNFYIALFLVNLLTFPITQLTAFLLFPSLSIFYNINYILLIAFLIEPIRIYIEYLINLQIYRNFNGISYFEYFVEKKDVALFTITANIVSLGLELAVLYILGAAVLSFA